MRLTRIFFDTDLRCSFEGLRKTAKSARTELKGNTVMFMNRAMTAFKVVTDDKYIVYFNNRHRRIPIDALKYLPQAFGGTELEMKQAIEKSLRVKLRLET